GQESCRGRWSRIDWILGNVDAVFRWHCPVLRETFERRMVSAGKAGWARYHDCQQNRAGSRSHWSNAYLDLIKTGFDWALPPPATMITNDIPALASGTVASIAVSLMNLNRTGVFEAALKVTV